MKNILVGGGGVGQLGGCEPRVIEVIVKRTGVPVGRGGIG